MKVTGIHERTGYVEVRVEGPFAAKDLPDFAKTMEEAVTKGASRILVHALGVTGPPPSILDRYKLGNSVRSANASVRVAMVAPSPMLDPDRFGMRVAQNRGVQIMVFDDEADAVTWLTREAT